MLETRHEDGTLCNEDLEKSLSDLKNFEDCICKTMISPNCQSGFIKGALEKAFGVVGCLTERLCLHSAICDKNLKGSDLYIKSFVGIVNSAETANECMYVALFTTDQYLKYKVLEKALGLTDSCEYCAWIYKEITSETPLKLKAAEKIRELLNRLGKPDHKDILIIIDTIDEDNDMLVRLAKNKLIDFYSTKPKVEDN
jgi:hypothetical protein